MLLFPCLLFGIIIGLLNWKTFETDVNNSMKIVFTKGGIMTCSGHLSLSKTSYLIFDEKLFSDYSLCLDKIYKIETLNFSNDEVELYIFHSNEDSPMLYKIKNENLW
jgi:hypothetical protein